MRILAAVLLTAFSVGIVSSLSVPKSDTIKELSSRPDTTSNAKQENSYSSTPAAIIRGKDETVPRDSERLTSTSEFVGDPLFLDHAKPTFDLKNAFLQEIHTLDEVASRDKTQDEVAKTFKAEARRIKPLKPSSMTKPLVAKIDVDINNTEQDSAIKKLLEAEDVPYDNDLTEDEEDESDNDNDSDVFDDDLEDDEEVMTNCPDYCKCIESAAATCTKLVDNQSFSTDLAHLCIENAEQIRLGPKAFRSRGLEKLETLRITDTRIVELHETAFDGLPYLYFVNLTRNGLQEIPPNIFKNNTQLTMLAISGNPLKHTQESKSGKHVLFDTPSVIEFDFSYNGLTKLRRAAFTKMQSVIYVNLKNNKLRELDSVTFDSLELLDELDLSNNLLTEIPVDLFYNNEIQTLRVAGNNLTTLSTIKAPKLKILDASNNKIKIITKDDLSSMTLLDQLILSSNDLKTIHQNTFADLKQITHLDISNNRLTTWTDHHLRTNGRLQILLMNDNPELKTLPVFKTVGLEYETFSIYRFECANCGLDHLKKDTFNAMPALTQLNLSRNRLTGLTNGLLERTSTLQVLDLSDNKISSLDRNMFHGAISLTKINLAGNPLVTLQVTPFLVAPNLAELDVSRCALERVWNEARVRLTSLRFLSVRDNHLRQITLEELKAMPNIDSLDMTHNPFDCNDEFNEAVQWLTSHGVSPMEKMRFINNYSSGDKYHDSKGISEWTDLAKIVCQGINDGPPDRSISQRKKNLNSLYDELENSEDSDSVLRTDFDGNDILLPFQIDHGIKSNEEVDKAWTTQDQEYEEFVVAADMEYHPWYTSSLWPVIFVIFVTAIILLLTVNVAIYLARRRGRGPVIRPPMILRQGLIDNKNCGLVYKPLQEEIATPHMPKRGSFYSSSTFHYDKIVPESI
ncbi:leucine-rich repeat domain-containing glycoprotein 150 [Colletes latitarsis]|uniref:leucine-rich repeat domain-containing glycoprotein 150 n=1 Tax=Colletes latitarsis TaxID=2605962 RepID=UPI004035E15C